MNVTKKTLYLENPTRQEFYDAWKDASVMGYKRLVAHGHKVREEFGVRKKIVHLTR
jgi:hypothetical protein